MFYVYVLKSLKDNKLYIGHTSDIKKRVEWHNAGKQKSTKYRLPLKLAHVEIFSSRSEAMRREKELKTGKGKDFLKKIIK
ncbi:MAG: GIY-YIG nuclease family protein [Elusimicrobia bacterium]|nr:GIY-YIG nuclease family protein [Elusimicrobiota bacterium]